MAAKMYPNETPQEFIDRMTTAAYRFRAGDRVVLNGKANSQGIGTRCKTGRGVVVNLCRNAIGMVVLLDGYKKPNQFHHSFFDRD